MKNGLDMKAKVKATGEIIEVELCSYSIFQDVSTSGMDEKTYYNNELEFLPDTPNSLTAIWPRSERLPDGWSESVSFIEEKMIFFEKKLLENLVIQQKLINFALSLRQRVN